MNIIQEILNDSEVLSKYKAIDKFNPYPFNHGMKHIHDVLSYVDVFSSLFHLTERETLLLKIAESLHDIGQVDGRENHALKASIFAQSYLQKFKPELTDDEISEICSAIRTHDEKTDYSKLENKYSWFVNLIDKMDFTKDRLEDNYLEKFDYIEYNDIEKLEFSLQENVFTINIKTIDDPKIISEEMLFNRPFFNKVVHTVKNFCNHFGLTFEFYLNAVKLNTSVYNSGVVTVDG